MSTHKFRRYSEGEELADGEEVVVVTREKNVVAKISVAVFAGFLLQFAGLVSWGAKVDLRVETLEKQQTQNADIMNRTIRIEEKVGYLAEDIKEIKRVFTGK